MGKLSAFLSRNTVTESKGLPYVHATRSYNIAQIKSSDQIKSNQCKHFNEDLTYLFIGRPAYKRNSDGSEAEHWELPCCFIFDTIDENLISRIFPFDSGAYKNNLYPDYINFMPINEFETKESRSPGRIISALYGNAASYFRGKPKNTDDFEEEFQLGVLDAEIKALRKLAGDGTPANFDDRRLTIEVQISGGIDLGIYPPTAVVLPSIYMRDPEIRDKIINEWKADPITYEMFSLSHDKYDGIIYAKVREFYESKGLI